ncbi:hypothetical protein GGS20DRAFT_289598 [Poronia punctata]|nr:hypothetical protein GGS20DRAFT_289598 [Poronia punctata]
MSKKRTIDAYFSLPKGKKPREDDSLQDKPTISSVDSHSLGVPESTDLVKTTEHRSQEGYSMHPSYPFPIPHLPNYLKLEVSGPPARPGRAIADQPNLDLLYFQPYISRPAARQLFEFLRSELPFYRVEYEIMRGGTKRPIRTPRWTTVFGIDETASFTDDLPDKPSPYGTNRASGGNVVDSRTGKHVVYKATPRPIPQCLDVLRKSTEAAAGSRFNFCLVNYYASGADSISYHSDDERFLGPLPAIASFSLGAPRDFLMKHKTPTTGRKDASSDEPVKGSLKLPLTNGDMVLMRGKTQANWVHKIPKRSGKNENDAGRINITFRRALVKGGTENYYQYNVGNGPVYKWSADDQKMKPWIKSSNAADTGIPSSMPSNASIMVD